MESGTLALDGPLDLEATLYSGQAFRWQRLPGGVHQGWIQNQPVQIEAEHHALRWRASVAFSPSLFQNYFRLDASHDEFLRTVPADPFLRAALARFPGLRLLRQDPWEILISFIISQNSNEAKIRRTVEGLCRVGGAAIDSGDAPGAFRFPTPATLAGLTGPQLRSTGMGYRAPYVEAAARAVASGALDPWTLHALPYQAAFERLMDLPGVGAKVADCILLYGCDHRAAFPTDVWVRRFVHETYLKRPSNPSYDRIRAFAWRHFGAQAGYAQHYLFHYRRAVGALRPIPA